MDNASDVERLFSWLKTEDLRYREFAASREVTDAVATWPTLHRTAAETGRASETAAPEGDAAAKERLAREQMTLPPAAAEAIRAGGPNAVPPPPLPGGRLISALGRRMHSGHYDPAASEPPGRVPPPDRMQADAQAAADEQDPAARERARDAAERLRERLDAAMAVNPRPASAADPAPAARETYPDPRQRPAGAIRPRPAARGSLFGGAYRSEPQSYGSQPYGSQSYGNQAYGNQAYGNQAYGNQAGGQGYDEPPREPEGGRRGHSLQAVFSRLSSGRGRSLPDPRERARSSPGLGSVFNRLR